MSRDKRERTTTIISLWPNRAFDQNRPSGTYVMEPLARCDKHAKAPCKVCREYQSLTLTRRAEGIDIGDDKRRVEMIDDNDLARDLAESVANYGVLAIEGAEPTAEELDEAFANLEKYLVAVLETEDQCWAAAQKHFNVQHAIIAANYFGVDRDWLSDTRPKTPCEACGTHNSSTAVKCSNPGCGAVLDWEKARNMGVLSDGQVTFGIASGKLKPVAGTKKVMLGQKDGEL